MKKAKCIHPKKAQRLMQEFLNDACDLKYLADDSTFENLFIRVKKGEDFSAESPESTLDWEELVITYNYEELYAVTSKWFRKYWSKKNPIVKGFSDIVISLLHELGHLEVNDTIRKEFSYDDRAIALTALDLKAENYKQKNMLYFKLPDEKAATEWAINWLSSADNRKKAKKFEKEFFKCFE